MSDRDALLAAIRANPDDDLPRFIYADWLDEYGPTLPPPEDESAAERAEFIRDQIEAARAEPFSPAAQDAEERADQLIRSNEILWQSKILDKIDDRFATRFVRGFVEGVSVTSERFMGNGKDSFQELLDCEPIRSLTLNRDLVRNPAAILEFCRLPQLSRIRSLSLQPALLADCSELDAIAQSDGLKHLRHLSLAGNAVLPRWLTGFLAGPHLPHLAALDLSDIPHLGPALAAGLTRANHRRFTRLDFSGVVFNSDNLKEALAARCLTEIEELRLAWPAHPTRGPLAYLNLGWVLPWERLRLLDIGGQGVGAEGVREMLRNPETAGLRWLGLASNGIGSEGAQVLRDAPHLNLYDLNVSGNGLKRRDVAALRERFPDAIVRA